VFIWILIGSCSSVAAQQVLAPIAVANAQAQGSLAAERHHVTAVRFWSLRGVTRIAIETDGEFQVKTDHLENPGRIFFDLVGTKPALTHKSMTVIAVSDRFVKQIRVAEPQSNVTRVVLDLETTVATTTSRLENPDRLIIELRAPADEPRASGGKPTEAAGASERTPPESVKTPLVLLGPTPAAKLVEHRQFTPPPPSALPSATPVLAKEATLDPPPELAPRTAALPEPRAIALDYDPGPAPPGPAATAALAKATLPAVTSSAANDSTDLVYGSLNNASLLDVIDLLAGQLKINYVLDPKVQGGVTLHTYGETKAINTRSLLESILRINGYGMVQQGDFYRIVPTAAVTHMSIAPENNSSVNSIPEDDRTMLNLLFVKYLSADELLKVLNPFLGENAKAFTYPPANLMFILDSRRNVRRLLELVSLFDDVKFAHERVRIFSVKNARPEDLAKELDSVIKPLSKAANFAPVLLLPVDRIGAIVAVGNPSMFPELEQWLLKLDVPESRTADTASNHVYKVKYGDASDLGQSINMLYGMGDTRAGTSATRIGSTLSNQSLSPSSAGLATSLAPAVGPGSYGNGNMPLPTAPGGSAVTSGAIGPNDLTGTYLGATDPRTQQRSPPRVVPQPSTNALLIQAIPADYANILSLLHDLDVPPRQVLIEAKVYEVDLDYSFSSSVSGTLQQIAAGSVNQFLGNLSGATTNLTIGALVGRSRELLGAVQLEETENKAKVISAPSVIATDSIAATMNVGTTVPTLSAQAVTGAQQNGSSLFADNVVNVNSGITLSVLAHVNASGIVTLVINQQVSSPIAAAATGIQSPSFSNRSVSTQVTVQDGDTIAIGGIIEEQSTYTTSGIPFLNRLPILGFIFGSRAYNKERTELIIFITPKVIYDTNGVADASDELKDQIKGLSKIVNDEQ
jgi:general secretion pathway protein D